MCVAGTRDEPQEGRGVGYTFAVLDNVKKSKTDAVTIGEVTTDEPSKMQSAPTRTNGLRHGRPQIPFMAGRASTT